MKKRRTLGNTLGACALALGCTDTGSADSKGGAGSPADAGLRISGRDASTSIPGGDEDLLPLVDLGPGTGGTGGTSGQGGEPGAGGQPTSGGQPATGGQAASPDAGPAGVDAQVGECAILSSRAQGAARPTDIVWFIDASPSMRDEIETVTANLNTFAGTIGDAGIDYRVVIVGPDQPIYPERDAQEFFPICVPPPLSGAAGCPDTDSDRYLHARHPLHSREALAVGLQHLPEYRGFLRPGAATHVVVVTDDDERGARAARDFDAAFGQVAPGYTFHSIVDFVGYIDGCGLFGDPECSCGENRGQAYLDLSMQTGGVTHSICDADWTPIFEAISAQVIDSAVIACAYAIPEERNGLAVDPDHINVELTDAGGAVTPLFNVTDAAGCAGDPQGWYYDDPQSPTQVLLCEGACGERTGEVQITFGCTIRKR